MTNKGKSAFGKELNSKLVGDAGEYLVCAMLSRFGISAGLMKEGILHVDILATIDGSKSISMQIKTSARLENNAFSIKTRPKASENFIFVFVEWKDNEEPIYYIVPSEYVYDNWKPNYINKNDIISYKDRWDIIFDLFR
jgi:hypothetical protein